MSIILVILIIGSLILLAGVLAAAEVAVFCPRRILERQAVVDGKGAASDLAAHAGRILPTVQATRVLLLVIAAEVGAVALTGPLGEWLAASSTDLLARHHAAWAMAAVIFASVFISLLLGELLPKQIARSCPETVARWLSRPLAVLAVIARPLVWLPEALANLVVRCCGLRVAKEEPLSIEDIERWIRAGGYEGLLDPSEQMLAQRALRLGDRTVRDIMHPRIEIDALDVDTPPDEVIGAVAMAGFSRLPIHEGDLDHIIGFVYTKDLLLRQHMGWPIELRRLVRPALLVPETLSIGKLLERFRLKRTQMAIVLDEFGGTEGLVTMEDVLEELVGEIHDEHRGEREHPLVARDDKSWYADGGMPLHDLLERLELGALRASLPADVSTVAGLVLSILGRIPAVGDRCTWTHLTLEVTAMEGRRLERVLIRRGVPQS